MCRPPPRKTTNKQTNKLTIRLVHIRPRVPAADDVLGLLALHGPPLVVFPPDQELVGAGAALEAVLPVGEGGGGGGARDGEDVGARGADCWGEGGGWVSLGRFWILGEEEGGERNRGAFFVRSWVGVVCCGGLWCGVVWCGVVWVRGGWILCKEGTEY